jgi:fumarylacetoacetate (FAA) hydrolase
MTLGMTFDRWRDRAGPGGPASCPATASPRGAPYTRPVKLAHVRERHAPAGAPWRLAAALGSTGAEPGWVDLEVARRRAVAARPALAHDSSLHRQPVATLDDHLARGLRVEALAELVEGFVPRGGPDEDDAVLEPDELAFGPPILRPPSLRDFYAFEGHVATMWRRRGADVPEAWYRLPIFYFSNVSELRGPDEPVWAPAGSTELDYELEVAALVDTPARDVPADRAEEAIGGYTILNDWSARDLQRDETTVRLGPAKGKDFASSIGPWLVTPDELASARPDGATGPGLAMTAEVNGAETSRGRWSDARFSFGEMLARASADVRLRPGDLVGSGTVGGGCLIEVRETTLGRYLEPGDVVTLRVERLGELRTPIVARPAR